jgi:hypothetical protein
MMRAFLFAIPLAWNAFAAGPVIVGARGGVPFVNTNDAITNVIGRYGTSQTYKIGPTVGARLPLGFSVEGDALFSRQTLSVGQVAGFTGFTTHSDAWEFPVMLKFTAGRAAFAPVFGAGVAVRHMNEIAGLGSLSPLLLSGSTSSNSVGVTAGAGVRFAMGPVSITPELRYTHWGMNNGLTQSLLDVLPWKRDEASLLVGITF